ncbi:hypothetical protein IGI04_024986 [Brassica rapa subsp. trilocularis]|uniref:Uncharacterized protein n=1 Tax=Brassica rapa subsp. trilocularis TaxID=1813537 RepID=A0ABQ7MAB9_BRACM|nr:hypothetical protein IGI04_024986 [Brassica rapa subsp. trilocularis]
MSGAVATMRGLEAWFATPMESWRHGPLDDKKKIVIHQSRVNSGYHTMEAWRHDPGNGGFNLVSSDVGLPCSTPEIAGLGELVKAYNLHWR